MSIKLKIILIVLMGVLGLTCEKFTLLIAVKTGTSSNITKTTVSVSGTVIDIGNGITDHGHCWSKTNKTPTPDNCDGKTELGNVSSTGDFISDVENLDPGTVYYIAAYASGADETATGSVITFTTLESPVPIVTTSNASSLTQNTATLNGIVNANGESTQVSFEYGTSVSYGTTIVASQSPASGTVNTLVSADITGLTANTLYHYRVKAVSVNGTSHGDDLTFSTSSSVLATLSTTNSSSVTSNGATSGGNITNDGGGPITARGVCWSTLSNPTTALPTKTTDGSGSGDFVSSITGLSDNTLYYVRAYATNNAGTAYGNEISFTTLKIISVPTLSTTDVTDVNTAFATSGGSISNDGNASITAKGVCWSTSQNPTIANSKTSDGSGTSSFVSSISGLSHNTTYYVRAYATNSAGTGYGNQISFVTEAIPANGIVDIDGNAYGTVTIGSQVWMKENLKVTKNNDGSAITYTTDDVTWTNATAGAYCWYANNKANKKDRGALYNWYVVGFGGKNVCPTGWHVPTDAEFTTLMNAVGGLSVAGGPLKATGSIQAGTGLWDNNVGATNSSGFTAQPAGRRYSGSFTDLSTYAIWWSNTASGGNSAYYFGVYNYTVVSDKVGTSKKDGYSIRCLKD